MFKKCPVFSLYYNPGIYWSQISSNKLSLVTYDFKMYQRHVRCQHLEIQSEFVIYNTQYISLNAILMDKVHTVVCLGLAQLSTIISNMTRKTQQHLPNCVYLGEIFTSKLGQSSFCCIAPSQVVLISFQGLISLQGTGQ